jgi:hypothetical protein
MRGHLRGPLPDGNYVGAEPSSFLRVRTPLPPLAGAPTNLVVDQEVIGARAVEIITSESGASLRCVGSRTQRS